MAKFRKKPVVIEAEQYLIGKKIPKGVNVNYPEIIFSRDGKLFYPSLTNSSEWLSIEKNKEGKYDSYPFAFYEMKSGERKLLSECKELFDIYQKCFNVNTPEQYVWIETLEGNMKVSNGDWVIKGIQGEFYPCKPDIFEATYEAVEDDFDKETKTQLTFGLAVEAAKKGRKIARIGWNGSGMFAYIVPANSYPALTGAAKSYFGENTMVPYREYWALKTAQNDVATWSPSGSDSLAEDWIIVD